MNRWTAGALHLAASFAVIGGFMSRSASAQGGEGFRALRIFEDVVTLILNNYVEEVDVDKVMHGAMHGLAALPDGWIAPLDDRLRTGLFGIGELRISELAERSLTLATAADG